MRKKEEEPKCSSLAEDGGEDAIAWGDVVRGIEMAGGVALEEWLPLRGFIEALLVSGPLHRDELSWPCCFRYAGLMGTGAGRSKV